MYDVKARLGDAVSPTELGIALRRGETRDVRLVLEHGRMVRVTVKDGGGEDAPAVPDASVAVQVDPLLLVSEMFLVVVPLWYVATTVSVLARLVVVQVSPAGRREFRVSGARVMMLSPSPATCTLQLPEKVGAPRIVKDLVGTAWLPGTVAVKGTEPPALETVLVIEDAGIVTE